MSNPSTSGSELNAIFDTYKAHRIGSHSDDWGGNSDRPCFCDLKATIATWHHQQLEAKTAEARLDENQRWLDRIEAGEFGSYVFGGAVASLFDKFKRRIATLKAKERP